MTYDDLRLRVVKWSLACATISFAVFLFAPILLPLFGNSMRWDQAWKLMQITLPVFVGYVGSAATFALGISKGGVQSGQAPSDLLVFLTTWCFPIYLGLFFLVLLAYVLSVSPSAAPGTGMGVETLSTLLTAALSLLTAVTNSLILVLFGKAK